MGLDISFELKKLLDVADGVETQIDVVDFRSVGDSKQRLSLLIRVPGMPVEGSMKTWVQADTFETEGVLMAIVRANKWGRVYEPLTTFLQLNSIEWGES